MSEAALPLNDRGLAYGDGVFETVLVRDGTPLLWDAHLARLTRGCERLGFPAPQRDELDPLPARAPAGLSVLKLIVTRGSGGRGYMAPADPEPRLLVQHLPFAPAESRWREGVRVRHCALRLGIQPRLAGLKHLNRLENVLARDEWSDPDIAEGLLCDSEGRIIEATCMNLFWNVTGAWKPRGSIAAASPAPCVRRCSTSTRSPKSRPCRRALSRPRRCGLATLCKACGR